MHSVIPLSAFATMGVLTFTYTLYVTLTFVFNKCALIVLNDTNAEQIMLSIINNIAINIIHVMIINNINDSIITMVTNVINNL